jgi:hypothetical protein
MPGGLMQLVNKGAQDQLVTGSPSFTHFRSVYKRHTEFAMEHFRLDFRSTNLDLNASIPKSMRVRVDRNAQMLHDCYVHVSLPDIYSPIARVTPGLHPELAPDATGVGYEFQWIPNLGYNMINSVSLLINGTAIVTHRGEWLKLYSYITHTANKRKIVDGMIGNVTELTDPANAGNRVNQYPHSITNGAAIAQPSILARDLVIPLHFWFCEDIGTALPLVALQYSEVEIVVEFASIYDLFTVRDVRDTSTSLFGNVLSTTPRTFGQRIRADPAFPEFAMHHFLSPPVISGASQNLSLTTWALNPYIEANYIFLGDAEVIQLAKSDNSFKIKENRVITVPGLYGAGNDIELVLVNLCTRVVWVAQRSDIHANNGVDNYTNQLGAPYGRYQNRTVMTPWYSSGSAIGQNQSATDILIDGVIVFDGAERFNAKTFDFFRYLENYRHSNGNVSGLPGIYLYSFALEHDTPQPSGHVNGSMFNKTILRLTIQDPPIVSTETTIAEDCILKTTALSALPVSVSANTPGDVVGRGLRADQVIRTVTKPTETVRPYTYTVSVYVESYNFLRITRGIANVVFSS